MDLASAQSNSPSTFASQVLTWLKWRYSPTAEVYASPDAENAVKQLNFPSVAHFLRPFFTFTEPVSIRGVNEQAMAPNSLHVRLYPIDRLREADATIRTAFFAKSLAEQGEKEFEAYQKDLFPILRKIAAQGASDDDLASSEVPLNHLLQKDISLSAQVRDALAKSQKSIEDAEAAGVDPSSISQPPLDAPKLTPGHSAAGAVSASMPTDYDKASSTFVKTAETLLKTSNQQWFATFIRDYNSAVRFSAFDPVDYPIAQVLVVTSTYLNQPGHPDCDVVRACQKMLEQSRTYTTLGGNNTHWPNWASISVDRTNICRIVFIIHDPKSDVNEKTVDSVRGRIASEICSTAGGCYILKVPDLRKRTRETLSPQPDERMTVRPWLNANSLYALDDYANSVERIQRQLENENLVTSDTSLEAAIAKVDSSTSLKNLAPFNIIIVNKNDYDEITRNVNNALRISLFPFIDRRLRTMSAFVSDNRQSALGKFASSLFSSDKNKMPSIIKDKFNSDQPRYRHDCLEMQMRRCADLCMAVQDYNSALNFYRMCRDEWKETLPSREFNRPLMGAAKEGIAVCMYLTGKILLPPTANELRRDPDAARFEQAREDYRLAKCANYTFRISQILIQMCRESKNPSHDRGIIQISPNSQVSQMSTLYQAIMYEQLALFRLISSPPIPILAGTKKWLASYLSDGSSNAALASLSSRPRSFALAMYEAAKRYHDSNSGGLARHALRCALAAWHVLRYRCGRSGSFPLLLADVSLFIAKRFILDSEPLQAAGFICFALHACGWSSLPSSVQNYASKQLKECISRASQRFGTVTGKRTNKQHVLIHSTLPRFAYSSIRVSSNGILQDRLTLSSLESASSVASSSHSTTVKQDLEIETERLYDDVRSEYSDAASVLNVPRNLHHYKNAFSKPHTEKKVGLSHQSHHHDDLYVPKPTATQPPSLFYTTSQNESLEITIGIRYRFPCTLRKVRLLYVELNKSDREGSSNNSGSGGADDNNNTAEQLTTHNPQKSSSSSSNLEQNSGNGAGLISDMLIGAGSRRIQHQDISVATTGLDIVTLTGNDQDSASSCSFTLPISFENRGTFAVVGFRYEAELPGGLDFTTPSGPVLHNCLFPCLQLTHQLYHESSYLDNISTSVNMTQSLFQCTEELMMTHASIVFSSGLPATHPSYLYVHVRAPTPKLTMEFCPPLPSACRNGELFSTQLVVKNSSDEVSADHARLYISECCGHMFALDVKPDLPSSSSSTSSSSSSKAAEKVLAEWKSNSNDPSTSCGWTRFVASDDHPRTNVGGLIRITIPLVKPGATFKFNCIFRAQGNDFLKNRATPSSSTIGSGNNNYNNNGDPLNVFNPLDNNDVASIVLFSAWSVPKSYLSQSKTAPAVSGAMLRCGRFYRRMLILPSISINPKCVSLVTTKPLETISDGKKTTSESDFQEKNNNNGTNKKHLPQVALAIDIRSEKRAISHANTASRTSSQIGNNSFSNNKSSTAASDSFFVVDDISIVSSGWQVKCLSVPTTGEGSPSRRSGPSSSSSSSKKNAARASLASRSVTSTTNWTCAAMLTRDSSSVYLWEDTDLVPQVKLVSLDDKDSSDDDETTSTSSDDSSDSSSSSSSDDSSSSSDDDDKKKKAQKKQQRKLQRKIDRKLNKPKKSHLVPSFASQLHFCIHSPLCGTGVLGRPANLSDGFAFYADGNEKKKENKEKENASSSSPAVVSTPQIDPKNTDVNKGATNNNNNNLFDQAFPLRSPSYEKELICLPDQLSPNERCPLVLRIHWREVVQQQTSDLVSKKYKTLRRGVSFDVVRLGNGDLHGVEALFNFRQRLFDEAAYRRENDGQTAPLFSPVLDLLADKYKKNAGETSHDLFVETRLLKESLRPDNPLSIPKIQCALSAPSSRVFSRFAESGFTAEVPLEVAIANQSPFPVLVSVFATPRYSGNSIGVPVIFSGRHAFTDIYLKPAESVSNLKFVALALSLGILDVASSCFSFEVVNALTSKSTRHNASAGVSRFSSQGSSALFVTSSGPAISSYASKQTAQALRAKAAAVKETPAPIVVFGNVAGISHSSLVRVEALRVQPPKSALGNTSTETTKEDPNKLDDTTNNNKSIFDLSFAANDVSDIQSLSSTVLIEQARREAVGAANNINNETKKSVTIAPTMTTDDDQQQAASSEVAAAATVPVRRRGERSSSRVCRSTDGSVYIPIKIEGVSITPSISTDEKVQDPKKSNNVAAAVSKNDAETNKSENVASSSIDDDKQHHLSASATVDPTRSSSQQNLDDVSPNNNKLSLSQQQQRLHHDPTVATTSDASDSQAADDNVSSTTREGDGVNSIIQSREESIIIEPTTDQVTNHQETVIVVPNVVPHEDALSPQQVRDAMKKEGSSSIPRSNTTSPVRPTEVTSLTSTTTSTTKKPPTSPTSRQHQTVDEKTVDEDAAKLTAKSRLSEGIRTTDIADFVTGGAPLKKKNRFESSSDDDDSSSDDTSDNSNNDDNNTLGGTLRPNNTNNNNTSFRQNSSNSIQKSNSQSTSARISAQATPRGGAKKKTVFDSSSDDDDTQHKNTTSASKTGSRPTTPAAKHVRTSSSQQEVSFPKEGGRFAQSSSSSDDEK